jgi:hypothetical protein
MFNLLQKNNVHIVIIPANCTDRLQPLDVSVNKAAKDFLRSQLQTWYSDQLCKNMQEGRAMEPIDLKMSTMKPLSVKWLLALYDYMKSRPDIIVNGFRGAGLIT